MLSALPALGRIVNEISNKSAIALVHRRFPHWGAVKNLTPEGLIGAGTHEQEQRRVIQVWVRRNRQGNAEKNRKKKKSRRSLTGTKGRQFGCPYADATGEFYRDLN